MSSNTKVFEDKMKNSVEHLERELAAVRAGRANPAVLDKVTVDYTRRKRVKRHPSGKPALVVYTEYKSLSVKPCAHTELLTDGK